MIRVLEDFAVGREEFAAVAAAGGEWVDFARSISRVVRTVAPEMDSADEPIGRRWTTRVSAALRHAADEFEALTTPCRTAAEESSMRKFLRQNGCLSRLLGTLEPLHGFVAELDAVCDLPVEPLRKGRPGASGDGQRARGDVSERIPRGPTVPDVSISGTEFAVMSVLGEVRPKQLFNVEIETNAGLCKQTVGAVVKALIGKNLVHRPGGQKKGATLTPEGLALFDQLRRSSADHP